ncbi:hypothetical protein [Flexivirga meconopsidis]|uniref:hypothetical protein n=1 Tax=Flexivirga meconopsidis TaxID=2977121 RepID=UPI00223EB089|nr:hypothetical protein [Flexivirga meconopsidis]
MTFVIYAVAAIYAVSIVFVATLLGSTLWTERRAARDKATVTTVAPVVADAELAEEARRTSVA